MRPVVAKTITSSEKPTLPKLDEKCPTQPSVVASNRLICS